jgi:hypothetical protein
MPGADFLLDLARETRRALRPLEDALADEEAFAAFLADYGWQIDPATFNIGAVADSFDVLADFAAVGAEIAATIMADPDEIPLDRYAEIVAATTGIVTKLRNLADRPVPAGLPPQLWATFTDELLDGLIGGYLETYRPVLASILATVGVVEHEFVDTQGAPGRVDYLRRRIQLDRLADALTDPLAYLTEISAWADAGVALDTERLFGVLTQITGLLGIAAEQHEPPPALLDAYYALDNPARPTVRELRFLLVDVESGGNRLTASLCVLPIPADGPSAVPGGLVVSVTIETVGEPPGTAISPYSVGLLGAFAADRAARLEIRPADRRVVLSPPAATVDAAVELSTIPGRSVLLLGSWYSHHLRTDGWTLRLTVTGPVENPELRVELALRGAALVLDGDFDGFLTELTGGRRPPIAFDTAVVWSSQTGLQFRGGAGLALEIPLSIDVGPVRLDRLDLAIRAVLGAAPALAAEARLAGGVTLDPFSASVEGIGVGADLLVRGEGAGPAPPAAVDLGPIAVGFRFLPPSGLGLSVDAAAITGGGFIGFDEPTGRYTGQLQLSLGNIGVDAVGLLDTRLPGGAQGFALLVLLRASFPPIQIGFGFALSSVGGLLALNRRVDVDALRSRMASGTAGRILAPEDPVRNAPVLLSDLAAVFPPAKGVVVVGPTLQLLWVDLVRFDVGLFFELPGPTKVVVLGSARAVIENPSGGRPYLQLRLDILGVADLAKQTLEFDAVLIDSNLLEILELTGGAAFRLSTGAEPYLVLTVGGFHPAYSPAPLVFPASLTRVAMTRGTPTDDLYFRFEGYFAITTNSLQFGASVEVIANAGSFNIRGFLGFDALIRFQPFHFSFTISASVKVRWKGRTLAGLELRGELSGPGPVVFRGKVCIELLFFDICFEETFTLGSLVPPVVIAIASAVAELLAELVKPANLRAAGAADPFVAVAPAEAGISLPVVSPVGQLVWSQERAPLDLLLQRFEGAPLTTPETVSATGPQVTGPDEDWFAPGGFAELSDADALNRRAFERLHGGVRLGVAGTDDGPSAEIDVEVKQIRIPAPPVVLVAAVLPAWVLRAAAGRAGTIERDPVVPALGVRSEAWVLRGGDGAVVADGLSQAQAHQLATVAAAGTAVARADTVAAFAF